MPKIEEILHHERERNINDLVLFLEGKFWKAYEQSAYVLTRLYGFKPTKRYIKLINEEVISVGFPEEALSKYLSNARVDREKKMLHAWVQCPQSEQSFEEWKKATRVKEKKEVTDPSTTQGGTSQSGLLWLAATSPNLGEEYEKQPSRIKDIGLPVFRVAYDLLLRLFHDCQKMSKDYRYTLGEDIKKRLLRLEVCIYHANDQKETEQKRRYITEALDNLIEVKICVRVLHDSKQLSLKQFAYLCEKMVEVEDHLKKWKAYYNQ